MEQALLTLKMYSILPVVLLGQVLRVYIVDNVSHLVGSNAIIHDQHTMCLASSRLLGHFK
jgi:hypothetical protein